MMPKSPLLAPEYGATREPTAGKRPRETAVTELTLGYIQCDFKAETHIGKTGLDPPQDLPLSRRNLCERVRG